MTKPLSILCLGASLTAGLVRASPDLRVLCFGDSLTAGYSRSSSSFHPYGDTLKSSLQTAFPSANITVDIQGLSGDQVCSPPGGFLPRMDILYEENDPYTHAIILGGTNDLAQHRSARDIYTALKKVWAIPLSNSTSVLALTIPECPGCGPIPPSRRKKINAAMMKHNGSENFYKLDLATEIPWESMPEKKKKEIWDDGVHFTEKGYELMGKIIAKKLVATIAAERSWDVVEEGVSVVEKVELKRRSGPAEDTKTKTRMKLPLKERTEQEVNIE